MSAEFVQAETVAPVVAQPKVRRLKIQASQALLDERVKTRTYLAARGGDERASVEIVAFMMWDDKRQDYYPFEEAMAILDDLPIGQTKNLIVEMMRQIEDTAVPPNLEGG